jgi:hypothetical protein
LVSRAESSFSLEDLVTKWRAEHELSETVESVRRSVADAEANRLHDLADIDAKIRNELRFPARR